MKQALSKSWHCPKGGWGDLTHAKIFQDLPSSYLISLSHIIFKNMAHVESFSNFVVVFSFSQLGSMLIVANLRSRVEVCNQGDKDPIQTKRFCSQQTHPE